MARLPAARGARPMGAGKIKLSQLLFIFVALVFTMFTLLVHIILRQKEKETTDPSYLNIPPEVLANRRGISLVDGEKKLKKELKKLLEIQTNQNKCLGIPVKSQWKDDGEPIWECPEVGLSNLGPLPVREVPDTSPTTNNTKAVRDVNAAKAWAFPPPNLLTQESHQQVQSDGKFVAVDNPPKTSKVIIQPTYGKHRPNVDAVFAFAQGYPLNSFVGFIQTLRDTGFEGDIVLSVSTIETLSGGVKDYLDFLVYKEQVPLVVYAVEWECFKKSGEPTDPNAEADCNLIGMYGEGETGAPLPDPRFRRPLATARFELYWAWATYYEPTSWILLMDFRDAIFQSQPFVGLDRGTSQAPTLYLFEENSSTKIGGSSFNTGWLQQAYGNEVATNMKDYVIICSGSTIGQQAALEPYARAMIAQYDLTKCKRKGCDQGFHNYVAYNNVLDEINKKEGIEIKVVRVEQGHGAVNNLGILRNHKLSDLGVYDPNTNLVLNWDKSISPIVHQFDRDDELKMFMRKKLGDLVRDYLQKIASQ